MKIDLKLAREEDKDLWDSLVEKSPHGTIFHTWEFIKIIEKHTNSRLYPIIGLKETRPIGIYPLFLQKKFFTRLVFSPTPSDLLLYMGPALIEYNNLKQSTKEAIFLEFQKKINEFLTSELKYNYVRIRIPPRLIDSRPLLWTGYNVDFLYTYILDISNIDSTWKNFGSQLRINLAKTEREGVTIRQGSEKELDFIRTSLSNRFSGQAYKEEDYNSYLSDIYKSFYPKKLKIFVGEHMGQMIGGFTLLCYKDRVSLWVGLPKTNLKGIYPNDLAIWESIKWASENGYKEYEIISAGEKRLRQFKSKFNPELCILYSAEKYSSPIYKLMDNIFRFYQKLRK